MSAFGKKMAISNDGPTLRCLSCIGFNARRSEDKSRMRPGWQTAIGRYCVSFPRTSANAKMFSQVHRESVRK